MADGNSQPKPHRAEGRVLSRKKMFRRFVNEHWLCSSQCIGSSVS